VLTKELERAGIPTVQITTMTPIAEMVGSNRVVAGGGIVHPVGNAELDPASEKAFRAAIVVKALATL
jgi:glycine reductase complex component B subunit gamma